MVERVALGYEGFMRKVGFDVKDCITERKFLSILPSMLSSKAHSKWTNEVKVSLVCKRFGLGGYEPEPMLFIEADFNVCRQRVNQIIDSVVGDLRLFENVKLYRKNL